MADYRHEQEQGFPTEKNVDCGLDWAVNIEIEDISNEKN
jgi:hypothetical protein